MGRECDLTLHRLRNEGSGERTRGRFYHNRGLSNSRLLCGSRWRRRCGGREFQGRILPSRTKSGRRRVTVRGPGRIICRPRSPRLLRWCALRWWQENGLRLLCKRPWAWRLENEPGPGPVERIRWGLTRIQPFKASTQKHASARISTVESSPNMQNGVGSQ